MRGEGADARLSLRAAYPIGNAQRAWRARWALPTRHQFCVARSVGLKVSSQLLNG